MNSLHKGPVTQKMFPFDDVIMLTGFAGPSIVFQDLTLDKAREWSSKKKSPGDRTFCKYLHMFK